MSLRSATAGYVALLAVLIVGAASLAIASALLFTATDSQRSTLVSQQSAQARNLATACAEEGLQKLYETPSYTGTANLVMGCSYTVTNLGGNNRQVAATATVNTTVVRRVTVQATVTAPNITITSWQEVEL